MSRMRTTISTSIMTCITLAALPARAADVTYERLLKPEPQNWLMNHRDFGAQRYSALDTINRSNVRNLKLAFASRSAARRPTSTCSSPHSSTTVSCTWWTAGAWSPKSTCGRARRARSSGR